MRIDFHSHILPQLDDGAKDIDESKQLLGALRLSGVDRVILTSHFYRKDEDINSFITRRNAAYEKLRAAADGGDYPELLTGAEVYFYPSLSTDKDFHKLCIENTDYVMVELPFEQFHDNFYSSFAKFVTNCDCKIILAHIERYLRFGNSIDDIKRLFSYGDFVCQLNCGTLANVGFMKRKLFTDIISDFSPVVIGTDTHNMTSRPPQYDKAESFIVKRCGTPAFERICRNGERILNNCALSELE